jgi:hypothetical protein
MMSWRATQDHQIEPYVVSVVITTEMTNTFSILELLKG